MRKQLLLTLLLAGGMFMVETPTWASPQQAEQQSSSALSGTVVDENGEPAVGASVVVKNNSKIGTAVDIDGNFRINAAPGTKLTVSYVGYKSVDVDARPGMLVTLERNDAYLDEVVVVGYGTQKKVNLTGAVSTVDVAKQLESRPQQDLAKALQGAVPGLTITTSNGDINTSSTMRIRGTGTLSNSATSDPLIVVDGVPMDDISFLSPDDIQDISVLKDAASSSIYGTRAAFGVILITTKTGKKGDRFTVKYSNNFSWSHATKLPQYGNVMNQIDALMQTNGRQGVENELFGMYLDEMLPYAQAWYDQNGGKKAGYREMRPFQSWDDVGDYYTMEDGTTMYYADWDVPGIYFRSEAPSNTHNVSMDGSSGRASYHAAFSYNEREGQRNYGNNRLRRYNVNANFQVDATDWLTAGVRVNFSNKEYDDINSEWNNYTYLWRWGSYFGPYGYMYDEDGNAVDCRNTIGYQKQAGADITTETKTRIQGWLRAEIIKGLSLNADFTYDVTNTNNNYNRQPVTLWDTWGGSIAEPTELNSTTHNTKWESKDNIWTANVYFNYEKSFNQAHNLKVMLGFNAEQETYDYFWARRMDLVDTTLPDMALATGDQTVASAASHRATAGFFGRINYDYKGIYLLEVNGRFDGSSRFPANDQWAFFPSMSVGYRFSEEKYWDGIRDVVNNAKLRFSYGSIGNEAIGDNMFLSTVSSVSSYWYDSSGTALKMFGMPSLVSETLSWERIQTLDLGLDLGFFNNSLNFTADIYQRDTKDMLAPAATLPSAVGASAAYQNTGSLRTRGWELGINWNHTFGDWTVYADFGIGDAKSVITEYNNDTKLLSDYWTGKTYGDIYGFVTDRYFEMDDFYWHTADNGAIVIDGYKEGIADQSALESSSFVYGPGDIKFVDLNGDGVIDGGKGTADDMGDLTVIGNSQPRYEYSFRVGATWKGFDLDLYFQGVGKRSVWYTSAFVTPMSRGADGSYDYMDNNYNRMIFADDNQTIIGYEIDQNNWFPCMYAGAGATGTVSGIGYGCYNFYPQTRYLQDLSYLRLKNLTFGYTIPADITRKFYVQNLRVYFSGENLFLLHDGQKKYPLDPEITTGGDGSTSNMSGSGTFGRTTPVTRSYSFGIQLTF